MERARVRRLRGDGREHGLQRGLEERAAQGVDMPTISAPASAPRIEPIPPIHDHHEDLDSISSPIPGCTT